MKILLLFILCIISFNEVHSEGFESLGKFINYSRKNDLVQINLERGKIQISVINDDIIRMRYVRKDFEKSVTSYSIEKPLVVSSAFNFKETDDRLIISTKTLDINIIKSPIHICFYNKDGFLINSDDPAFSVLYDEDEVRCHKKLFQNENFYGLGEKTGDLNRRGKQFTLWNTDHPAYDWNYDPLYVSIPFFIGVKEKIAYGIFLDNSYRTTFNFGASSDRYYWFGSDKGELDYYFIYGPGIKSVISRYSDLTGKIELPPKWSLGFQQSKWSYYPENEVLKVARTFREKNIPLDVLYLDIHYMDDYRVFTWDKNRFPDPKELLKQLKDIGIKVVPIIDPGVKCDTNYFMSRQGKENNYFAKYPDGSDYRGEVWPSWSNFPDFTMEKTRKWWGKSLKNFINLGISGFWNDMNEPAVWGQSFPDIVMFNDNDMFSTHKKIHNIYGLLMAKATHEAYKEYFPDKRFFTLSRAGFAGSQKYSAIWTGDNVANEEHLRLACLMPLGMGISGLAFVGSDVGGFIGVPSNNLYLRWLALGVFTPFFRAHSATNQPDKEPWSFGEETERIARELINMRYRFIPYIYNEFKNSSQTGLPLMKPMFLEFQNDEKCYFWEYQYQFMFGDNLLVAPILSEKENFKKVYFPDGDWYSFNENRVYKGGKDYVISCDLSKIPLFIRHKGIIPVTEIKQFTDEKKESNLEFIIFSKENCEYTLYDDDGSTNNYRKGDFNLIRVKYEQKENEIKIIIKNENTIPITFKGYQLTLVDINNVSKIKINNELVNSESDKSNVSFDKEKKILKLYLTSSDNQIDIILQD